MARHRGRLGRTLAFRHYLWDLGFGVAEAMDTAQRGMGLDWTGALELIRRSLAEAKTRPARDRLAARAPTIWPPAPASPSTT